MDKWIHPKVAQRYVDKNEWPILVLNKAGKLNIRFHSKEELLEATLPSIEVMPKVEDLSELECNCFEFLSPPEKHEIEMGWTIGQMTEDTQVILDSVFKPVEPDVTIEAIFNQPIPPEVQPTNNDSLLTGYLAASPIEKQFIQFSNMAQLATSKSYREMWQSQADFYQAKLVKV